MPQHLRAPFWLRSDDVGVPSEVLVLVISAYASADQSRCSTQDILFPTIFLQLSAVAVALVDEGTPEKYFLGKFDGLEFGLMQHVLQHLLLHSL